MDLPHDSIKNQFVSSLETYAKVLFEELQNDIKKRAEENPDLLKVDPAKMNQLSNPDGFMDYMEENDVNFQDGPGDYYNFPELNKMILDLKPDEFNMSFGEMYLNGVISEDKMRLDPHVTAMKSYLPVFEQEIEDMRTINNEMWISKLKQDTYSYVRTVLSPEFAKESTSYVKTEDNMRVDVGLVITRDPIFLT